MNRRPRTTTPGRIRRRAVLGVAAITSGLVLVTSAPSGAAPPPGTMADRKAGPRIVTTGLDGPFGLARTRGGLLVAESASGQVTLVGRRGGQRVVLAGVPGVAGVAARGRSAWSVIGGPNEQGSPSGGAFGPSTVLRTDLRTGRTRVVADLLAYEKANNPDGQDQSVDALSNPFSMVWSPRGLLVADGGANDVLRIDPRTGRVTTFFVPPNVTDVPACVDGSVEQNPGTTGCDSVPTGVDVRGGSVYVSTLGAEVPGAGRIYKLSLRTGKVQRVWRGLDSPSGVAAGPRGTVYYSQVLYSPTAQPDPDTAGRVVRVGRRGSVAYADVRTPTGLEVRDGRLYASANSLAPFFGQEGAGSVVRLGRGSFR